MPYKEIQVPNGTVREIYEKFLTEVTPLSVQEAEKNDKQTLINHSHRKSEAALKKEYRELIGYPTRMYDLEYYDDSDYQLYRGIHYTAQQAVEDAKRMLEAVRYSEGDLTMTQDQVNTMQKIGSGETTKAIRSQVEAELYTPISYYAEEVQQLKAEQKAKQKVEDKKVEHTAKIAPKCDPEEENPSFVGALLGLIALGALIVVLLKSCGG